MILSKRSDTDSTILTGTELPSKSTISLRVKFTCKVSLNQKSLNISLIESRRRPLRSVTIIRSRSVATKVGVVPFGSKILEISKLNFPATIL